MTASIDGGTDRPSTEGGEGGVTPSDAGDGAVRAVSLTIDRTAHDFGTVVTQTPSADALFTVKNSGTAASANLAATLSATAASLGFAIKGDHCSGMSLAGGASCEVTVVLTAASAGSPSADLTVSAGPGASVTAHLTGTAITPGALRMTPDTQNFGMVVQNRGSASQTFTITNGGQQATGAANVVLDGTDKAEFEVTADGCGGQTLAANSGSCQITVRFAPAGLGAKSASLTVSGSPGGTAVAQLSGTGITQGTVTITPDTHDFGAVEQMMPGASQVFTVKNTGQATTGSLATALSGSDSPNFSMTANTCDGHTLVAGGTCAVTVQFKPVTAGPKLVNLSVAGAPGETGVAQLSGTSLASASITITPMTKSFNSVTVNQSGSATFVVANPGGVPTGIPTVTVAGVLAADAGQFSAPTASNGCTASIPAGQSCMITVRFAPTTAGIKNGTLTVSASPGTSATATLTGTGNPPGKLSISPLGQDFGPLPQGSKGTTAVTLTVTNTGASPTGALQASIVGSTEFQIMRDSCSQMVLGVPGSCAVDVIFAPTTASPSGTLQIVATNPADSTQASLTGTGLAPAKLMITPTTAPFADTVVNQTNPVSIPFTVRNSGGVSAGTGTGLVPVISGTNQADFGVVANLSNCTGALAAGAQCTVVVAFTPKTSGNSKTASLTVNAMPGGPVVASLGGNGITAAALGLAPAANNLAAFGNVVVGMPKVETFVVSNTGQQPSTGLAITLAKTAGPDFNFSQPSVQGDCAANVAVPGNSSCNLRVQFAPAGRGAQNASLSVSAATGGAPAAQPLTATGQLPAGLTANPASVNLGSVVVQGTPTLTSVMIINGGDVATSAPMLTNSNPGELTVSGCTAPLTATGTTGASCTLSLSFKATAAGNRSATVTVAVTGSSVMFTVNATAVIPCGAVSQPCCTGAGVNQCNMFLTCAAATSTCACGGAGQSCCNGPGGTCTATQTGNVCGTGGTCGPPTGNGVACGIDLQCASGHCTSGICCGPNQSGCGTSCVTLATDNANCGACGRICAAGKETCTASVCLLNDLQPCSTDTQCVNRSCPQCYPDRDGDTFGDKWAAATGACRPSCAVGFVVDHRDCLDDPLSPDAAQVNPNAGFFPDLTNPTITRHAYTPDPRDTSPNGWDWDCSGTVEKLFQQTNCGPPPTCSTTHTPFPDTSCGAAIPPGTCQLVDTGIGGLQCFVNGTGPPGLQCK